MLKKNHNQVADKLQKLLQENVEEINGWSGFSQRKTKLNAAAFAQVTILGWLEKPSASLNELVQSGKRMGLRVSEQGLQARLNERAVLLLAGIFKASLDRLRVAQGMEHAILKRFSAVQILDSTQVRLPLWLSGEFYHKQRGYSGMKMHLVFDVLRGHLDAMDMTSAEVPDQACDLPVRMAQADSLWLFDLGYFAQDTLQTLAQRQAYFVCRLQSQTAVYTPAGERFKLAAFLNTCPDNSVDMDVLLGVKAHLGVRLVARRVSSQIAQQRRRAAHAKAKKEGYTCSQEYLRLLGWECLLTTLTDLSLPTLFALYALRWQIELLFKAAKSQFHLAQLGHFKPSRLFCQLYARLIGLVMALTLTADLRFQHGFELSFPKAVHLIQFTVHDLLRAIAHHWRGWSATIAHLRDDFLLHAPKSKRRKSPSALARLLSLNP